MKKSKGKSQQKPEIEITKATGSSPGVSLPDVGVMSWESEFGIVVVTRLCVVLTALAIRKYYNAIVEKGKSGTWAVERWERTIENGAVSTRVLETRVFEDRQQAEAEHKTWLAEIRKQDAKNMQAQSAFKVSKPSLDEKDLAEARLKVLRQHYPNTFKEFDVRAKAGPDKANDSTGSILDAFAIDIARLHKPERMSDYLPFKPNTDKSSVLLEIAKAYKEKSPYDPVDEELAARWIASGYNNMSLTEYTNAVNAKCGTSLKPAAMEHRRYKKLSVMTKKPQGPSSK